VYKSAVCTAHNARCGSIKESSYLMMCVGIVAAWLENLKKYTNRLCRQTAELC